LNTTWDPESARLSMERWLSMCDRENWGKYPVNQNLLAMVFGASWYFTRFLFYRGNEITGYFDSPHKTDYSVESLCEQLVPISTSGKPEEKFEFLRIAKNELMLQIFLVSLGESFTQEEVEKALTHLAEAVLWCAIRILPAEKEFENIDLSILAMGRMAGNEMNFGSDLDLIFLYSGDSQEQFARLSRRVRLLLRNIALISPSGILYEVDMRLRPHGTSGTLISSAPYFINYHCEHREIWERQMMTRCRSVIDTSRLATHALEKIRNSIYGDYNEEFLKNEIIKMRKRVQNELGSPKDKYDIKRGVGGIMDIDFLTHYLQLQHGLNIKEVQSHSTRLILGQLELKGILDSGICKDLRDAYDFLKKLEGRLRVFDMKAISSFSKDVNNIHRLSRAMGFLGEDRNHAVQAFSDTFIEVTRRVRKHFVTILGEI